MAFKLHNVLITYINYTEGDSDRRILNKLRSPTLNVMMTNRSRTGHWPNLLKNRMTLISLNSEHITQTPTCYIGKYQEVRLQILGGLNKVKQGNKKWMETWQKKLRENANQCNKTRFRTKTDECSERWKWKIEGGK